MKTVAVIGLGYVGLPLALLLARSHRVLGVDIDDARLEGLRSGQTDINEAEVQRELRSQLDRGHLTFSRVPEPAEVFILCVPTPLTPEKTADLSYLRRATQSITPHLARGNLVILESTVPPRTCQSVLRPIIEEGSGLSVPAEVGLAHCPERLLPGNMVHELVHNSRIIGGMDQPSARAARAVYATFVKGEMVLTDDVTAEFTKLAENTYRDVNIALANELARIADTLAVDIGEVIRIANQHPRVSLHQPGIGVGGHCIPVDPWFLRQADVAHGELIEAARRINDARPALTAQRIGAAVSGIRDPRIVAVGLTYKPNVADLRESPGLRVVQELRGAGYRVTALDPLLPDRGYPSLAGAARDADCLAILVEHDAVRRDLAENLDRIKQAMRTPTILRF